MVSHRLIIFCLALVKAEESTNQIGSIMKKDDFLLTGKVATASEKVSSTNQTSVYKRHNLVLNGQIQMCENLLFEQDQPCKISADQVLNAEIEPSKMESYVCYKIVGFSPSLMREVLIWQKLILMESTPLEFAGGKAEASSTWGSNIPENAFDNVKNAWTAVSRPPLLIWYDFVKRQYVPEKIQFYLGVGTAVADWPNLYPTHFEFVGSNDVACSMSSEWSVFCEGKPELNSPSEMMECRVETKVSTAFRCLGIKVLSRKGSSVWLENIRIWGAMYEQ